MSKRDVIRHMYRLNSYLKRINLFHALCHWHLRSRGLWFIRFNTMYIALLMENILKEKIKPRKTNEFPHRPFYSRLLSIDISLKVVFSIRRRVSHAISILSLCKSC